MKRLWFFFPENDIALAHGNAGFTAPAAAVALRRAGEVLPLWMASPGDYVLCNGVDDAWMGDIQYRYGIVADVWNHEDFDCIPTPWGWSAASRRVFENCGFAADRLPSSDTLDCYRQLSHRRTSAALARMLSGMLTFVEAGAMEISDQAELAEVLGDGRRHVVKSPWSSSGRGVRFVGPDRVDEVVRQAVGTIRRQGSVMVEPTVDDRMDFALLYEIEGGAAHYRGLSLFATDMATGRYMGNIVAAQDILASRLSCRVSAERLARLVAAVEISLNTLLGADYVGPVGVDLMAAVDGSVHVAEMNLRYTMGFLSLALTRLVPSGKEYIYEMITGRDVPDGAISLTPPSAPLQFVLRP